MMFSVKGKRADAVRKRSLFDAEKYETMVQMNGKRGNKKGVPVAKNRNRKFAVFLLVLVVFMVGFVLLASSPSDANYLISNVSKGKSQKAYMEVADSDFARMRGLMFRDRIIPILFIFEFGSTLFNFANLSSFSCGIFFTLTLAGIICC